MHLDALKTKIEPQFYEVLDGLGIKELRPSQEKSIDAGLFDGENLLVCTPTASGKTLVAELAMIDGILKRKGKAIYIVPLKALATEKYKEMKQRYGHLLKVGVSIGDLDSADPYIAQNDLIFCTSEKLDSLIRHRAEWLKDVATVVVDEGHLLNDASRGPTLEILLTILRDLLKNVQIIALSATIGNPNDLADWLEAKLVEDKWRPVELHQGVLLEDKIEFKKRKS